MSRDFFGSANSDGYFTALNPAWERTFGFSLETLMSKPFLEFVHPADRERTVDEVSKLFEREGVTVGFENRYMVRGEGWRWLSWHSELREGSIHFIAHDVTERVTNEYHYRLLSRMVEGVEDAIFTNTTDGVVTYWNPACEQIYGFTAAEAVGRSMSDLIVPDDLKDEPGGIVKRLLGGHGVRQYTTSRRHRDGRSIAVSQTASLMRDDDNEVIGVVVVSRDVSGISPEDAEDQREIDPLIWVGRIRDALDENRIIFYLQPIISLEGDQVSYELLCRMVGRNGEIIAPGRFLPAAENYGLIEEVDLLALREAARLIALGHQISINLSTATIGRRHVVKAIAEELRKAGAQPEGLTVEITETVLMRNMESAQRFAEDLCALGPKLALDDFGTGFGGFTYLKKLPVNRLKIDVEFVRDLRSSRASQHVVRAVVSLAEGFGLDTVAEGVEDAESAEILRKLGVTYLQGYHFAKPGPIDEIIGTSLSAGAIR
ncbi:MAG: EAL domain-containing protein [Solirubrobacterales bacterium]